MYNDPFFYGLILAPVVIAIELKVLIFFIRTLKLNIKLNRPVEVISLIVSEFIAVISSLKIALTISSIYLLIIIFFLLIKIYGLWKLRKWVLYVYIILIILPLLNGDLFRVNNLQLNIVTLVSRFFVLLVYYLYVYKPNKKEFK